MFFYRTYERIRKVLVLTRLKGERIRIGDDVVITVVETRSGGSVRLGIEAPAKVRVHREEVYQAIKRGETK